MRIVTDRDVIKGVLNAWVLQYPESVKPPSSGYDTKHEVYVALSKLDLKKATADDVCKAMALVHENDPAGYFLRQNTKEFWLGWVELKCNICGKSAYAVVALDELEDGVFSVCFTCVRQMGDLIDDL